MGLGMQYLRLLWQAHHIADNTSKDVWYLRRDKIVDELHNLSTFRSCVTNGEIWVFFILNVADSGEGGTLSISKEFRLGEENLSGLPLVLGLLSDWVSFDRCFSLDPIRKTQPDTNSDHELKKKRAAVFRVF